jgi:hypothetical protein
MRLTSTQLSEIATKVESLDSLGLDVKEIQVEGHRIYLDNKSGTHVVVGISIPPDKQKGQVMR